MSRPLREQSALSFVLRAFIPYTRENLLLSFSPNRFFNELDRTSNYSKKNLQQAYYRAKEHGYFDYIDTTPLLSELGRNQIERYTPLKLGNEAALIVVFDIPETMLSRRNSFRGILKSLGFVQIQKSV